MAAVRSNPLLAEADAFQALGGSGVVMAPESPNGIHILGGASDQTAYVLDGTPVFSPYHVAGLFGAWNPDALSRIDLYSSLPPPSLPAGLSGIVAGVSRAPGPVLRVQGALSTSQARLTADGPLGVIDGGYLLSVRRSLAGGFFRRRESTYLRGDSGDEMGKLELPAFGGRFQLLAYDNTNGIDAMGTDTLSAAGTRNTFRWGSRSLGAQWSRERKGGELRARGWRATGRGGAAWNPLEGDRLRMTALREDLGLTLEIEKRKEGVRTVAGIRVETSHTSYRVSKEGPGLGSEPVPVSELDARTPRAAAFVQRSFPVRPRVGAVLGADLTYASEQAWLSPGAELRWDPTASLSLSGTYAHLHQFAQSLRNSESVVGNIFPVDLFLGAEPGGVPVARSHQGVLSAEYHPSPTFRLGGRAYVKHSRDLLLLAPVEREPFATGTFGIGSGSVLGFALHGALTAARFGIVARYGWQHVRLDHNGVAYSPTWGASHLLEAGIIVFPTSGVSLRMGGTGAFGRKTTGAEGALEWESCNLLDAGCEFGGSPRLVEGRPGATRLPPYFRLDLKLEAHRHVRIQGRDVRVSVFGTASNLLGRRNLLTFATDPATGKSAGIEMRPPAPLAFGLEWSF